MSEKHFFRPKGIIDNFNQMSTSELNKTVTIVILSATHSAESND